MDKYKKALDCVVNNRMSNISADDIYIKSNKNRKYKIRKFTLAISGIMLLIVLSVVFKQDTNNNTGDDDRYVAYVDKTSSDIEPPTISVAITETHVMETEANNIVSDIFFTETAVPDSKIFEDKNDNAEYDIISVDDYYHGYDSIIMVKEYENITTFEELKNKADLIVIGEFSSATRQKMICDFERGKVILAVSINYFIPKTIFKGEIDGKIAVLSEYAVSMNDNKIYSFTKQSPMVNKGKWILFLKYESETGYYKVVGDFAGRYPVDQEIINSVDDFESIIDDTETAWKYGVHSLKDFNVDMFRQVIDYLANKL